LLPVAEFKGGINFRWIQKTKQKIIKKKKMKRKGSGNNYMAKSGEKEQNALKSTPGRT